MNAARTLCLAVGLAALSAGAARAVPLAPIGDGGVRRDLELLWEAGVLPGPVMAWPMSWEQFADTTGTAAAPWVEAVSRRLRRRMPEAHAWRVESWGALATDRDLIFSFDSMARRRVDVHAGVTRTWNRTTARLALGYMAGGDEPDQVVLDGSYVSQGLGNWVVYGGAVGRWYGPGLDAGLVLSRNARPVPGVGVFRNVPRRSHSALLKWMGPWRVDAFLGVLNGERGDHQNPFFVNLHWSLQPWSRVNLAFTRGIMICGEGRPCDANIWLRSLIGVFDLDNSGHAQDASNQTASVALAYTFPVGGAHVTPYAEVYIEDEIEYMSPLAGVRAAGPLGRTTSWQARFEYCDTYADRAFGTGQGGWFPIHPGVTYGHSIYTDGYTYRDDWLGHSMGQDGRLITLAAGTTWAAGWSLDARARIGDLRLNPLEPEPALFQEFHGVEVLGEAPFGPQRVIVRVRWQDRDPFAASATDVWEAEAGYRVAADF